MKILNCDGLNFAGQPGACHGKTPRTIEWDHACLSNAPTVHLDRAMLSPFLKGSPPHYGWVLETPATTELIAAEIKTSNRNFTRIFTHSTDLSKQDSRFVWVPASGIWIRDIRMHVKTKLCSMITSPKAVFAGHRFRLQWAEALRGRLDMFGLDSRIAAKEEGLREYMFSVAIENAQAPGYFTEKILDCFATGTIPVYYGAQDIGTFFNSAGIVLLQSLKDWSRLTPELYHSMLPAVRENFERALQYEMPDDWLAARL